MKAELINATNYANIYCLYDSSGKPIGTKEVVIAGRDVGIYYYSLTYRYTVREIKAMFRNLPKT